MAKQKYVTTVTVRKVMLVQIHSGLLHWRGLQLKDKRQILDQQWICGIDHTIWGI